MSATKLDAEKDGVIVPQTLLEYCVKASTSSSRDAENDDCILDDLDDLDPYEHNDDDDDDEDDEQEEEEEEEEEDNNNKKNNNSQFNANSNTDSGNEETWCVQIFK